jgi:two-component system OmpR family response regulator
MRLLIVEDNLMVTTVLKQILQNSYQLDHCERVDEAMHLTWVNTYAAMILDLGLPDGNGIELCRNLRRRGVITPIMIVTGQMDESIKVDALDAGADDYLVKPFSINELNARIRALLRRSRHSTTTALSSGSLHLDPVTRQVNYGTSLIVLRRKEFDLLELFLTHPNQVLTRTQILEQVWEHDSALITNAIDVHVKHLRDLVDRPFGLHQIQTVHGIGYKFVPNETKATAEGDRASVQD